MRIQPVIRNAAYCLAHVPELVRYGSKPSREIVNEASFGERLSVALRGWDRAVCYPPNQVFIGNLSPEELAEIERPWYSLAAPAGAPRSNLGRFGQLIDQATFYAILKRADVLQPGLVELSTEFQGSFQRTAVPSAPLRQILSADACAVSRDQLQVELASGTVLPLWHDGELAGVMRRDNRAEGREDDNLNPQSLLETLTTKATAATALQWLLHRENMGPEAIDYLISCGEEAAGDRYQRGGGGVAKAVGEMCGCVNASGMDVKNFCAAPASALVTAAALVAAGVYQRVAVVAGGSLAKLGMKCMSFLSGGLPILDDCLASHAFLVTRDDGVSPWFHLEPKAVGTATIGSSTADEAVYRQLLLEPLKALGLSMTDVDKYAPELHNPEIMEHAGSGDVVHKNYRMIAAMAVRAGAIQKHEMQAFAERVGMLGFAPTQGHIPSGVAYIGHALQNLLAGQMKRVMILSKASLFLNRLTGLYDGVSFLLEANPNRPADANSEKP